MNICVIPARGGSKRIPRKNIRLFNGKPMIAWSIEAAQKSNLFDKIIVSTDDEEIALVAREFGAHVPFLRPAKLSDDYATTTAVMAHSVRWALEAGFVVDIACCLYATAPFVAASDLKYAFDVMNSGRWSYVFTVGEFSAPIYRSFKASPDGGVCMLFPEYFDTRSQDLPDTLFDAGMFYLGSTNAWLTGQKIFDSHSYPIKIPSVRVHDIDTQDDWARAELVCQILSAE